MRSLKDGKLDCHWGDDRWLTQKVSEAGLASAYGYATVACGFKMLRHEGKLTGLAAYGEPKLADEMAAQFRFTDQGLIETDFSNWKEMRAKFLAICEGKDRETIAASIQKVAEDFTLQSVGWWLGRTGARKLALAGGLFANVRLNRLLAELLPLDEVFVFPAMGDDGLPVGAGLAFLHAARRHRDLAAAPPSARQCVSWPKLRWQHRRHAAGRRHAAAWRAAGRNRQSISSAPARRARSTPAAWSSVRAPSGRARSSRVRTITRSTTISTSASRARNSCRSRHSCWKRTRRAYSRSPMSTATRRAS